MIYKQLVWFNFNFQQELVLKEMEEPLDYQDPIKYNPVSDFDRFSVNQKMDQIVFKEKGKDQFLVYDLLSKRLIKQIKIPGAKIPFNLDWGQKMLQRMNARLKGMTQKGDFPEFFPVLSWFYVSSDDRIIVFKYNGLNPDEYPSTNIIALNFNGKTMPTNFLDGHKNRIRARLSDGRILVSRKDDADEPYSFCALEEKDLERFIKSHPIVRDVFE